MFNSKNPIETYNANSNNTVLSSSSDVNSSTEKLSSETDSEDNPLYGKTAIFDGDSYCHAGGNSYSWADYIGKRNNMTYTNCGEAGATISNYDDGKGHRRLCDSIETLPLQADYVILEGGANDSPTERIGKITDGYESQLDETTFCGAMESLCKKALARYFGKKIGFIMGWKATCTSNAESQAKFELQRQILKKWNIPYLDLYKNSGLDLKSDYGKFVYSTDGQHLKEKGYNVINPQIEDWIKSIK
jgi:lysophospholipase L1-like esterase